MASKKVLVVEDIHETVKGTLRQLESRGAQIVWVRNVQDAIDALQVGHFGALLLDWRVPLKSTGSVDADAGAKVLKWLREHPNSPNSDTPVFVLTAQRSGVDSTQHENQKNTVRVISKLRDDQIQEAVGKALGLDVEAG
jgi:CheY-like chemotaxis protein